MTDFRTVDFGYTRVATGNRGFMQSDGFFIMAMPLLC